MGVSEQSYQIIDIQVKSSWNLIFRASLLILRDAASHEGGLSSDVISIISSSKAQHNEDSCESSNDNVIECKAYVSTSPPSKMEPNGA